MAYFVKIDNPKGFRRDILVTSKQVINSLQANRNVLAIREKKKLLLKDLQLQIKELVLLTSKLDELLPDKQLREEALRRQKEEEMKTARAKKVKAKSSVKKNKLEKDKLEDAKKLPDKDTKSPSSKKKTVSKRSLAKAVPLDKTAALDAALAKIEQKLASLN